MFHAENATDTATDNHADTLVVGKIRKIRVGKSLVRRLDAKFGSTVLFFGIRDFVQRVAMDFRRQIRIALFRIDRGRFMDARNRVQSIFPSFFHVVPDGANYAQTRNNTAAIIRCHGVPSLKQILKPDVFR